MKILSHLPALGQRLTELTSFSICIYIPINCKCGIRKATQTNKQNRKKAILWTSGRHSMCDDHKAPQFPVNLNENKKKCLRRPKELKSN